MTDVPPPAQPPSEPPTEASAEPPTELAHGATHEELVVPVPPIPHEVPAGKGPIGRTWPIGMTILLSFVTCGIYFLYWTYVTFEDLKRHNNRGLGGVVGLVLGVLVSIVNMFVLPAEVQSTYADDGRESPVSPIIGLWGLLPIVGWIIWYVKVQTAINDYWVSKGATPA